MTTRRLGSVGTLAGLVTAMGLACCHRHCCESKTRQAAYSAPTTNPAGIVWNGTAGQKREHVRVRVHFKPAAAPYTPIEIDGVEFTFNTGSTAADVATALRNEWNLQPTMLSTAYASSGVNSFTWKDSTSPHEVDRYEVDSFTDSSADPVTITTTPLEVDTGLTVKRM